MAVGNIGLSGPKCAPAPQDKWYRVFLNDLLRPGNVWVREVLISLQKTEHTVVPADVREEITMMLGVRGASVPVEESFKELSSNRSSSGSLFMGRVSRWHRLIASDLLESHTRARVQPNGQAKLAKIDQLRSSNFEGKANSCFSLGQEVLDELGIHDPLWRTSEPFMLKRVVLDFARSK